MAADYASLQYLHKEAVELLADFGNQVILRPPAKVKVIAGNAEIFGAELECHITYDFPDTGTSRRLIVTSYHGSTVELEAECPSSVTLTGGDPFVRNIGCVHSVLQDARRKHFQKTSPTSTGPVVIIVGPKGSGKSTICRTLANYAILDGTYPTLVDLDPGQQGVSLPGVLSSVVLTEPISPAGITSAAHTGLAEIPFGHVSIKEDFPLFIEQLDNLAEIVRKTIKSHSQLASTGVIINTAGWIDGEGLASLHQIAKAFFADLIVVLDSDALYRDFVAFGKTLPTSPEVVFLNKPVGITEHGVEERRLIRNLAVLSAFSIRDSGGPVVFRASLRRLTFYRLSSFRRIMTVNGANICVAGENLCPQSFLLNRLLYISSASDLRVDLKKWPLRGHAILLDFNKDTDEAWLATTLATQPGRDEALLLLWSNTEVTGPDGLSFSDSVFRQDPGPFTATCEPKR